MDTKKDIGQFFKENLNQMDFTPNDNGWNKIEEELDQKKKKRRAFFWLFFAAFLAGCIFTLLLVYSTNWMDSDFKNQKKSDSFEKNSNSNASSNSNINSDLKFENSNSNNQKIKNNSNTNIVNNSSEQTTINNNQNNNNSENNELKINSVSNRNRIKNTIKNNNSNINNSYSTNYNSKKNSRKKSKKNYTKDAFKLESNSNTKVFAQNNKKSSKKKNNQSTKENTIGTDFNNSNSKDNIAINNAQTESKIDTTKTIITLQETKDTLAIAAASKKQIKKPEPKKEKDSTEVKPKEKTNSFIVSPYYGTGLFPKNQVKGNFNSNNLVSSKNEQYGILIRWMTSRNYGLQVGIGYINNSTVTEIEKTNSNNIVFNDVNNNSGVSFSSSNKLMMHHDLSMYEIPLEFYYKILDKKIGFALSSGISHTIIKENSVSINNQNETIEIGPLETLTKSNFTANLKFYSFYKFSDKLQFEVYPSFHYHFLNSMRSNDLNPSLFSIRAGISYQF
ncbi:hypothetical protein [Flavobacterium urocaniciphilum]|uniref:Outer membrane protein beta-barrel domain-containing protein n=1 Tax=Flavobacterium urocaniciphilum TaxID=1299341 RepID=A0A1H9APW8_9FLAO|nr:hypothetical protein [Flavobacterium urocaniciphilum]SEP78750.1 hypothetical protein SAMN05444005_102273 [Flavobacterium urocaniciphilum]